MWRIDGKKNLLNKIGKEIELNSFKKLKLPQKWAKRLLKLVVTWNWKKKEINKTRHEIQRDDALCCIKLKIDIKQVWKLEESCSWLLYEIKKRKKIEYSRNKLKKIETKKFEADNQRYQSSAEL